MNQQILAMMVSKTSCPSYYDKIGKASFIFSYFKIINANLLIIKSKGR